MPPKKFAAKIHNFVNFYYLEILYALFLLINLVRTIPPYQLLSDFWRSYILNYYVLSYQSAGAFVSRGLIGSILQIFFASIDSRILYFCLWLLYFFIYFFAGKHLIAKAKKIENNSTLLLFICVIMFSPAVMNYAIDFGRPDIFMVLLTILCMALIYFHRLWIFIPALCTLGMLIHEGFFVFFLPMILSYMLIKIVKEKSYKKLFFFFFTIIGMSILLFYIFSFGKSAVQDVSELYITLQNKIDIVLNPNMIGFEFGSLKSDLSNISIDELSFYKTQIALFFYAVIFTPVFILYFKVLKNGASALKFFLFRLLYIAAPFSGLLMIFVGVDYGRWFSMAVTACIIHGYFCIREFQINMELLFTTQNPAMLSALLVFVLAAYLAIGPMGDIHEHFEYINLLNCIYNYATGAS